MLRFASLVLTAVIAVYATAGAAQQRPPIIQPGTPGEASRIITPEKATDLSKVGHTAADVRFMQGMIAHHAQALEMTALRPPRSTREGMRLLTLRIELSQADEIKLMEGWLKARGEEAPDPQAHLGDHATLMPGMLTTEEMSRLRAAKGDAFDRLFLELMIKHHAGALVMVEQLFATAGAGQESEIFAFASDVVDDQRIEIDRMAVLLKELQK